MVGDVFLQLLNESLMDGNVQNIFKISTVNPAAKIPSPKTAEEFRPINSLSTLDLH